MNMPRSPLVRRFGAELLLRLDQFLGRLEEPISPRLPVSPLSVERHLADPILLSEDIERLIPLLAASLKADLERRGEGARRLELALFRVDGIVIRIAVGTSRALRDPLLIGRLFHERLAAHELDAGFGFDLIRLSVRATAPFETGQFDLAGEAHDETEELAFFADRLCARLGAGAIMKPLLAESHIPERAAVPTPFFETVPGGRGSKSERHVPLERPIRLFRRPEHVEVVAEVPEGPPLRFRWRNAMHKVIRSEGPERIEAEWWRDEGDLRARDYFRLEDEAGRRYWIYRQGFYGVSGESPHWFMHGIFA